MRVLILASLLLAVTGSASMQQVDIDPDGHGLRFDGNGGLSAGASSRLLYDYPENVRSDILDYLYKPNFGANLHICKVEIGGDTQSTDGTEPSHMHSKGDLNCDRGYEFWLMKEAKKRNPDIITYGLSWGAPAWVGEQKGYYSSEMLQYQLEWVKCARDHHGVEVDWLGLWNERPWGTADYVKALRKVLDENQFTTQLVLGDGGMPDIWGSFGNDTDFTSSFGAVGLHYPCQASSLQGHGQELTGAGKKIWASEDWWSEAEFPGAVCWAKLFNQNFIRMNITSTISWSTIWSVYPQVDTFEGSGDMISGDGFWGPGLMYAWQPWSGHYTVAPTVWASAHTTQFAKPGWKMLTSASGNLDGGGSYVSYVSPDAKHFATVLETGHARCAHCAYGNGTAAQNEQLVRMQLEGALSAVDSVAVWHTNLTHSFEKVATLAPSDGLVDLMVLPESIYTVSSTTGQSKGQAAEPSPSGRFPTKWSDDFESYPPEGLARFWADQCGSFQVAPAASGVGQALEQRVTQEAGVNRWAKNLDFPLTVMGDWNRTDSTVSVGLRLLSAPLAVESSFRYHQGRVVGGSYDTSKLFDSLQAAESFCQENKECNSITFESTEVVPKANQQYWFSSNTVVANNDKGWHSYMLTPPHPTPESPSKMVGAWGGLCSRITNAKCNQQITGACLQVNGSHWQFGALPSARLGSGKLPKGQDPSQGVKLSIETKGVLGSVSIGGVGVGTWNLNFSVGMFGLITGWNEAQFDDFSIN